MSILFADIYDGIRAIRITKGVSEKDILNYVQDKVGGCMKVGNVLKTIRTLKKLCEDGVLMKKGKRYMFPPKCGQKKEEEEEEEEDEEECDDGEELDMEDDECDQGEDEPEENGGEGCEGGEEEGGEEEEDEEEEEEEEDDDDDECDEKDERPEENGSCSADERNEDENCPDKAKGPFNGGPGMRGSNGNGGAGSKGNGPVQCAERKITRALIEDDRTKKGRKETKDQSVVGQEPEGKNNGNEAIAFCARDFIDALGRRTSGDKQEQTALELAKGKKRMTRNKRKNSRQCNYRSRSPRKEGQSDLYNCMGDENGIRMVSSDLFQEPADVDMDVDMDKDDISFDAENHPRMSMGLPNTNHLGGLNPLSGDSDKKTFEGVKMEQSFEELTGRVDKKGSQAFQVPTANCPITQMTWYPLEDRDKDPEDQSKRSMSSVEERSKDKSESLCSVCEKKKRNP